MISAPRLLEASGAIFHALTLQQVRFPESSPDKIIIVGAIFSESSMNVQARHYNVPIVGVYLAHAGYMLSMAGVAAHSLVCAIAGHTITDLDSIASVLEGLSDGERTTIRCVTLYFRDFPLSASTLVCSSLYSSSHFHSYNRSFSASRRYKVLGQHQQELLRPFTMDR